MMDTKTPAGLQPDPGVRPQKPHDAVPPPRRKSRAWVWFLLLIVAAAVGYYYWQRGNNKTDSTTAPAPGGKSGKKGGRGMGGPTPVVAVHARRGNIGVYVDGLGNVIPIYTVTVKSRVDGQLMDIHYKEGDTVQKGQPLLELDPRPFQVALEQAEGQLARDQALLSNARVDLARYQTLIQQNAIPEQQLATQKALVAQYEGTVKTDQGVIDNAKLNITYCNITAPITGRIGLRLVDPGNIVHASDPNGLLVITQMEPISVIFPISEKDLAAVRKRVRAGQRLAVDAWDPDAKFKLASGFLATIDNQIDQTTGTVKLRAEFDNKDNALFPNQFINARLLVEMKQGVVLLPTAAVQRTTQSTYVWLLKPDNSVTIRNITEGTVEGDQSEITSGLQAGDSVVMTGVDKLIEGSKVNPTFNEGGGGRGRGGAGGPKGGRGVTAAPGGLTNPNAGGAVGPQGAPTGLTAPPNGVPAGQHRGRKGGSNQQ